MSKRLSKGQSGMNRLYNKYKYKALARGLEFKLTKKLFRQLTSSDCFYCGEKPSQIIVENNKTEEGIEHSKYIYNGLDRLDNDVGYTALNVVPCCRVHNEWKRAMSYKTFVELVHKTSNFLKRENNGTEKT